MSTLKRWTRRSQLLVIGAALLSGAGQTTVLANGLPTVQTRQSDTLGSRMAGMSGTGLSLAECRQRMQDVDTLLRGAGYGNVQTHTLEDGTLVARWYHTDRQMTALAFSGQHSSGNAFSVGEYAGIIRWNELIALP
ncbi:hypothetical protein V3W47_04765 [Deinococcus sp. YIM 134068]|uniref:hypothetical protein n=1 Tax=Deinococcus lichenicola TaxID=3118910 RepID=UPI002F93DAE7